MKTNDIGKLGEMAAAAFLRKSGYNILCANYRTRLGEIDIIAADSEYIVFTEVKTRAENSMIQPREAVTRSKQLKIIKAALQYIADNQYNLQPRFDVIEVVTAQTESFNVISISHLKNAFTL